MRKVDNHFIAADILRRGTQQPSTHISLQKSYIMPQDILQIWCRGSIFILLLLQLLFAQSEISNPIYLSDHSSETFASAIAFGGVIQIKGKVIEQASRKPFELAVIIVKCGDEVVASKHSAKDGSFLLTIPREKVQQRTFALKIKYLDHIFIQDNIKLAPQEMLIEINGEIFHDTGILEAYQLPVHTLGTPKVGSVTSMLIRPNTNLSPSKI